MWWRESRAPFLGFFGAILRRSLAVELPQQQSRHIRNRIDRHRKSSFVCLRRFRESADLPDELERSRADLLLRYRRIEVKQWFDIPAHAFPLLIVQRGEFMRAAVAVSTISSASKFFDEL